MRFLVFECGRAGTYTAVVLLNSARDPIENLTKITFETFSPYPRP